jgi:hypothetical protein
MVWGMRDGSYKMTQKNKHSLTKEKWDRKCDEGPEWIKVHAAICKGRCNQLQGTNGIKVKVIGMMSCRQECSELLQDSVVYQL